MRNKLIIAVVPLFFSGVVYALVGDAGSNPVYVAGSYGYLAKTKADGSLNTILYPKVDFTGVDYGNNLFVAVGKTGQIMYMPKNTTQWQYFLLTFCFLLLNSCCIPRSPSCITKIQWYQIVISSKKIRVTKKCGK